MTSFEDFCSQEFITGDDKETFRVWLGHLKGTRIPKKVWYILFSLWIEQKANSKK